jgi:Mn2+/Fe2+ NRAMP family transporter
MLFALFLLVLTCTVGAIGYHAVGQYRDASGTTWQRLLSTAGESATVLWQYAVVLGAWLLSVSGTIADAINLPDVRPWLASHLSPEMAGGLFAVVAAVTVIARLRTL